MIETNSFASGTIRLRKLVPPGSNPPANFTYQILSADGTTVIRDNIVVPSDGTQITVSGLPIGMFRLVESEQLGFALVAAAINGIPTDILEDDVTHLRYIMMNIVCGRDLAILLFNINQTEPPTCDSFELRARKIVGCFDCLPESFMIRVLNFEGTEVLFDNIILPTNGDYVNIGELLPGTYRIYEVNEDGFKFSNAILSGIELDTIYDPVTDSYYALIDVAEGMVVANLTICNRKVKSKCPNEDN